MQTLRTSPARLTASATLKLPRSALFLLCLLYLLPGLFWHDPWKAEDATGFGVMWTMARGTEFDWLMPNVVGAPVFDSGPLTYWVGAAAIRLGAGALFGWIDAPLAARLATVLLFLIAATALWYATYLLGRLPVAQPLRLAFGGQPEPRDYGRTLADGALLILLGTLGLTTRAHESSSDVGMLAMLCLTLYGWARSLDRPRAGAVCTALGVAGVALTRGPYPAALLFIVWTCLVFIHRDFRRARWPYLYLGLPVLGAALGAWPLATYLVDAARAERYFQARLTFWLGYPDGIDMAALRKYGRNLGWYLLPGWPIALWGVWSWRRALTAPHMLLPLGYLVAMVGVLAMTSDNADGLVLMLLPGTVMLAACGLPTLKRGAANAIDWFSLLIYSLSALGLWISWLARLTGIPGPYARTLGRLVPGLAAEFHWVPFLVALAMTAAWIWLVRWRVVTHPKVLWRSVVLASGGVTLCWALAMTLLMPELDYSRSYRDVALKLKGALPAAALAGDSCISAEGLGLAQRASFAYFSGVRFARLDATDGLEDDTCPYLLRQDSVGEPRAAVMPGRWQVFWEGRRASDRDERFRLYRRLPRPVS